MIEEYFEGTEEELKLIGTDDILRWVLMHSDDKGAMDKINRLTWLYLQDKSK